MTHRFGVLICLLLVAGSVATAQRAALTEAQVRGFTKEAVAESAGDSNSIIQKIDAKVKALNDGVEASTMGALVHYDKRITIFLGTPYALYRLSLIEALRKRDPIEGVPWVPTAFVSVTPSQIDSPDIVKVIVERDGKVVTPVESTLLPKVFETRMGGKTLVHAGQVHFPMSAFGPGGSVVITAIPESGVNFVTKLDDSKLRTLR